MEGMGKGFDTMLMVFAGGTFLLGLIAGMGVAYWIWG